MLILAVDTSGRRGSVACVAVTLTSFEVLAQLELEGGTYSARLVPCIAELLGQRGFKKSDIDGIAVVDGPGIVYWITCWALHGQGSLRGFGKADGCRFHAGSSSRGLRRTKGVGLRRFSTQAAASCTSATTVSPGSARN